MFDSRLVEREKLFKGASIDICKKREEFGLTLRKDRLFDSIMEKRLSKYINVNKIDTAALDIPEFLRKNYQESSEGDKMNYLINWLMECDNTSANGAHVLSDIQKFAIHEFKKITDDFNLNADEELDIDNNLLQVLFYDMCESRDYSIKYEISIIFINLTYTSRNITQILLDPEYLTKFIEMTYLINMEFVENIIDILINIVEDHHDQIENFVGNFPIIFRIKELLADDKFEDRFRLNLLCLLKSIIYKMDHEKYIRFIDHIPYLIRYIERYSYNEEILWKLLLIMCQLSLDDKNACEALYSNRFMNIIIDLLSRKNLLRNYIVLAVRILGNIMYAIEAAADDMIDMKILYVFEKIINSYSNSAAKDDNKILVEVIWASTNIAAGTLNQVQALMNSNLPCSILHINRHKKDNDILRETILLINSVIRRWNLSFFSDILKINAMRYVCEGILTTNPTIIYYALKTLLVAIELSLEEFKTTKNIEDEIAPYNIIERIDQYTNSKNKDISDLSVKIIDYFTINNGLDVNMIEEMN